MPRRWLSVMGSLERSRVSAGTVIPFTKAGAASAGMLPPRTRATTAATSRKITGSSANGEGCAARVPFYQPGVTGLRRRGCGSATTWGCGEDEREDGEPIDAEGGAQTTGRRRQLASEEGEGRYRPLMVTTAVAPIRKGRAGSRSSRRIRTGKRLARRTQLRVRGTLGSTPTVGFSSG